MIHTTPLAVIGNLTRDVVDGLPARVGGAPFHAARALRVLGRPARVVTKLAEGDRHLLLPPLVALGVPVVWRAAESTAGFSFTYHGERRTMAVDVLGASWSRDDAAGWVRDAVGRCEWVHVAPLVRSDFSAEVLAEIARGRRLSLDGQGLVRPARLGALELDADFDRAALAHAAVLKLAEEEASTLLGSVDESSLATLGVPEVVVTLGSRGCLLFAHGRLERVRARAATGRVDPTGAGDAFAAAYLTARSAGHAPVASARRATALVGGLLVGRAA